MTRGAPRTTSRIVVLDLAGEAPQELCAILGASGLEWAPDGSRVAFVSQGAGGDDIVVQEWPSGTRRALTGRPTRCGPPEWSPDGSQIAFWGGPSGPGELYVVASSGGVPVRIQGYGPPSWSPDGSRVAFAAKRAGASTICVALSDGSSESQLFRAGPGRSCGGPRWSPDGAWLTFTTANRATAETHIHVMRADGSGQRWVSQSATPGYGACWAPSGLALLFAGPSDGRAQVFTATPDLARRRNLSRSTSDDRHPEPSPDGGTIAFERGESEIWFMDADGQHQRRVFRPDPGWLASGFAWSPSGKELAVDLVVGGAAGAWGPSKSP